MKRSIGPGLILGILLMLPGWGIAQYSTTRDSSGVKSSLRIGLRFKSDQYYMGRADSAKAPYFTPSIGYYHKSGLFISGSLSYVAAPEETNRIDLYTLGAGYDYFGRKFAIGLAAYEYIFSDESYAVQAEMNTFIGAYAAYDFRAIMLIVDGGVGLSEKADFFLGAELSKTFYLAHNKLLITPLCYVNFGTQHYYNEYYTYRSLTTGGTGNGDGKGKGGMNGGSTGSSTTTTMTISIEESDKFQVLDYEAGLQLAYKLKNWRFSASGTVFIPVNPSTIVTDTETFKEDLGAGFMWSLGIRYNLKF